MTQDEIIEMTRQADIRDSLEYDHMECNIESLEAFAKLVAAKERERIIEANAPELEKANAHIKRLEDNIETLHAMYEQVSRQRDELMDVQRSMVEAMRGRVQ